ncbi:MAG TPA: XdhC family protein, partial [Roseateles sp.]
FGAGHVGRAIARIARDLPLALHWIDSREDQFPAEPPAPHWRQEAVDPIADAVPDLASASAVLIMSYSHAEDFNLVAACLKRQRERSDLPFIGLIGSKTKWASFRHRLQARGFTEAELAQVVCPIGLAGVAGKQPGVIAVAVMAQILSLG